jgi:glycogen debranching enzyme
MSQVVSVLDGNTFVVSDRTGNVAGSPSETHGLFFNDTRFLSRWVLTINGQRPGVLSVDDLNYFSVQFFLTPSSSNVYVNSGISLRRKRAVGGGFHEDLTIENHETGPVDLKIRIEAASDFADLFEVKDELAKRGELYRRVEGDRLVLGYRRERFLRETWISASAPEARYDEEGVSFQVRIEPQGSWNTCIEVVTADRAILSSRITKTKYGHTGNGSSQLAQKTRAWIAGAPKVSSSWLDLPRVYDKCISDLAALRFETGVVPGCLPAAGLPWFMATFGRDSMLTSFQALPFKPDLAKTTLEILALLQGAKVDDFRDEEPGKIIHELRLGEMTAFEERPHSPYYGGSDSTPLFLVLLDEYERWSGDADLVRRLEQPAKSALEWIERYGDQDGDGYVEYKSRNPETGLENQCWKDSWDSIRFADGRFASLPRATCEIQGYVYDAKRRCARLAREIWNDQKLAERLEREAIELKRRFNRDFWLDDRGYFALALDGEKQRVDSLTSNIGHLLWSGIVDDDKAPLVARHLMSDRLFSGWGVRTMAEGDTAYNPIGYHVGTVWPHDCSFVALGLRQYGFAREAARLSLGVLEASVFFGGRPPEAFGGYPREVTHFPVEYPTACSPQAWASGAPLLLLRTVLGLEPIGDHLLVVPALPDTIDRIEVIDIPGRWGKADAFARGQLPLD